MTSYDTYRQLDKLLTEALVECCGFSRLFKEDNYTIGKQQGMIDFANILRQRLVKLFSEKPANATSYNAKSHMENLDLTCQGAMEIHKLD